MSAPPLLFNSDSAEQTNQVAFQLPLAAMVRALCRAATNGSDILYDVMLKLALMVDATAQTYGLATFAQKAGECPRLKWAEGLEPEELAEAEAQVAAALAQTETAPEPQVGDHAICLALAVPTPQRAGAAIYGRCVRHTSLESPRACTVHSVQLHGRTVRVDRKSALRSSQGRVHRRARGSRRTDPRGRRWHTLPRRDRRSTIGFTAQTAALSARG